VFVAASTDCFPQLTLADALSRLVDLEYTHVEIAMREGGNQLRPSQVHADVEQAVHACRDTHRLTPVAFFVDSPADAADYYDQFTSVCKLAKAVKVVCITVPAAELGTPFNAEVERLRELAGIAAVAGVVVCVKTEIGRMTQDPSTAAVLCDHVKGLSLTLDPSHYAMGPHAGANYEPLLKHVMHVQLRDTSKTRLQVRVGQGEVEYSRLISQLARVDYQRALVVDIAEMDGVDHAAELRKMRLLLESML